MSSENQTDNDSQPSQAQANPSQWLNPWGFRFWTIIAVLLYTVAGFLLVPYLVKNALTSFIENDLKRSAHIEKVRFNPYALSFAIEGFEVIDTDKVKLASFDQFLINFQLSSVFRWAWTFDEISLSSPYFFFERFDQEDNRISRLLEALPSNPAPTKETPPKAGLPRLLIHHLTISDGWGEFKDQVPTSPVALSVGPIDIAISELNTLPDRSGQQEVTIKLPDDGQLHWAGNIRLTPFQSSGELALENLQLAIATAYLKTLMPVSDFSAAFSTHFNYQVQIVDDVFQARVDHLNAALDKLSVDGLTPDTEFLSVANISLNNGALRYPENIIHFSSLNIEEPKLIAWLDKHGKLSLNNLIPTPTKADQSLDQNPDHSPAQSEEMAANSSEEGSTTPVATAQNSLEAGSLEESSVKNASVEQASLEQPALNQSTEEDAAKPPVWQFALDTFTLNDASLDFSDQSITPSGAIALHHLQVKLSDLNNQSGSLFPFTINTDLSPAGDINIKGKLGLFPDFSLNTSTAISGLPLSIVQPYVQQSVLISLDGGALDSEVDIAITPDADTGSPELTIAGSAQISGLDIKDSADKKPLLGWQNLAIEDFSLDLQAKRLLIEHLQFEEPFGRFLIDQDGTTNVSNLLVDKTTSPATTPDEKATAPQTSDPQDSASQTSTPMQVTVGGIDINNAALDFADLSLPLPFTTLISDLNGNISTIATDSSEPANIKLEGQVDKHGLARINGAINLLDPVQHTDIKFEFRNLKMANVSPYSAEFAGRTIDDGKLDVSLEYDIDKGQLIGKNNIVLSDLLLGEKIDSPNATSLPLDLAIALLKDSKGVIKADLPVTGNVNDPAFGIGGLIWDAFVTLVTKAVSAPFNLLGSLIGVESDDLGELQFLAGRADLSPPELEKIALLEKALLQRPELRVAIRGVSDPAIDTPALKQAQLNNTILLALGEDSDIEDPSASMLNEKAQDAFEYLFKERFPNTKLKSVKAEHKVAPANNPEGKPKLDTLAYTADLRDRLLTTEIVNEQALTELAQARAMAIKQVFLASEEFDANRVLITEPTQVTSEDTEWLVLELALSSD
ncbi:MAG: DUF748 domain-containing protein [Porticoccaceae bacterium]|nr:DUF748 domain-containing protein [Porticoccaceae bacterium]